MKRAARPSERTPCQKIDAALLNERGWIGIGELAERTGLGLDELSETIDLMVNAGLLKRRDVKDGASEP